MNEPSQLLARVSRQRMHCQAPRRAYRAPAPAPMTPPQAGGPAAATNPIPAAPTMPVSEPRAPGPGQMPAPAPAPAEPAPHARRPGGHGLYSQVMRSHDRMGTRHLQGNQE